MIFILEKCWKYVTTTKTFFYLKIIKLEYNKPFVNDVVNPINDIHSQLVTNLPKVDSLSEENKCQFLNHLSKEKPWRFTQCIFASSILDPRTQGANLKPGRDIAGIECIYNVTKCMMHE